MTNQDIEYEIITCECCPKQFSEEIAWTDSDGVQLCPQCAYQHLNELIDELHKQTEWQPIEAAPRDGTEVLICKGIYRYVASLQPCINCGKGYEHLEGKEAWHTSNSWAVDVVEDPDAWMLLPTPPEVEE